MNADLETARTVLRKVAEEHLMDDLRHLHSRGSLAMSCVIEFLLTAGEAEYHDRVDPLGSGQIVERQIRLKPQE